MSPKARRKASTARVLKRGWVFLRCGGGGTRGRGGAGMVVVVVVGEVKEEYGGLGVERVCIVEGDEFRFRESVFIQGMEGCEGAAGGEGASEFTYSLA